jgi:putative heme-binding domain-containing protein
MAPSKASAICALVVFCLNSAALTAPVLELAPGDNRVVLIGDSQIEQAQFRGDIELRLMRHFSDQHLIFRNLGWSGDDVRGNARTPGYQNPATFDRLIKQTAELKPDLILIGYGTFESFDGADGLAQFREGYSRLLDELGKMTPRVVLLSPAPQEDMGRPLPDPTKHNEDVAAYSAAIQEIAAQRKLAFVDLFHPMADFAKANPGVHFTDNGIALNDRGYQLIGVEVEKQLGFPSGGVELASGPDADRIAKLREAIVHRNEIYYRRWHPWNDHPRHYTYLEKDYPLYDQTIAELDKQIADLAALTAPAAPAPAPAPAPVPHAPENVPANLSDDPETERKLLELSPGLDIQLYASEPLLQRPVTMNFDAAGRLWVLCIPQYPQLLPGQDPADYVAVLEDRAGKGQVDASHVFVKGLRVATGMIPDNRGGAYIGEGDLLLHFADTKGTGAADERRVVYSGFGTSDTHHTLNTFHWGNDGFLYFNQGWYINSSVETPWGPRRRFTGCIWQMRPETLRLEIYDRSISVNNTWGLIFDNWGQPIISSPWPADINLVLPDTPLNHESDDTHEPAPPMSMTKIAGERLSGLEMITGRHFPAEYQNNLIAGGFNSQRVYRYKLDDTGDRPAATELPPLIVGHHSKFRPIDVKMGPDGALYILDWYNIIIQHNQVDFHDSRRDHTHGRIWRITARGRPLVPRPQLVDATIPQLLDHLKDPEDWTRVQAKCVLSLRDPNQVAAELARWTASISAGEANADHHLLEALWTYQTIDVVEPDLLGRLLRGGNSHARAAATTVLGYWYDRLKDPIPLLAMQANDDSAGVRLSAVLTAQRIGSSQAAAAGLAALDRPADDMLKFELRKLAAVLKPYWLPKVGGAQDPFAGNIDHLLFALEAIPPQEAIPLLLSLIKDGKVAQDKQAAVLERVAAGGTPQQQGAVLDAALGGEHLWTAERASLLTSLVDATRSRGVRPDGNLERIITLMRQDDPLALAALRAAAEWKIQTARPELERIAGDPMTEASRRQGAILGLVALGGDQTRAELQKLSASDRPYALRIDALAGMASMDTQSAAAPAATLLHDPIPGGGDPSPLFAAFLHRAGGPDTLAAALKANPAAPDVAKIGLRQLYGAGIASPQLVEALGSGNATTDRKANFNRAEQQRLVQLAMTQGDPARGEKIFRSAIGCTQCHAIAGVGGHVAPDLSMIGTTAQPDFLVEHLILPGKSIKEGFAAIGVTTTSGDFFLGIRVRESERELILRDATHDQLVIRKDEIKSQRPMGTLMPSGLTDTLTDNELADLIRFLAEEGKPHPR